MPAAAAARSATATFGEPWRTRIPAQQHHNGGGCTACNAESLVEDGPRRTKVERSRASSAERSGKDVLQESCPERPTPTPIGTEATPRAIVTVRLISHILVARPWRRRQSRPGVAVTNLVARRLVNAATLSPLRADHLELLGHEDMVRPVDADEVDFELPIAQLHNTIDDATGVSGQRSFGRVMT